jgi:pSer/pThr/pTyr-binding forkhead associated (FHA) protein/tetratricopeptide (TPR) repeat protein
MRVHIHIIAGRERGQEFILQEHGTFTVGRSRENEISILDEKASRKHCKIQAEDDGLFLCDLNSLNGTFLNSRMIVRRRLSHGDRFRAGSTHFEVLFEGRPRPLRGIDLLARPLAGVPRVLESRALSRCLPWLAAASVVLAVGGVVSTGILGESKLSVESMPPYAMVFIDGQYAGQTPLPEVKMPRGYHLVKVQKHGNRAFQKAIELGFKALRVDAELEALPTGGFEVETRPAGAEIYVDGEFRGMTPKTIESVPLGQHALRISMPEYLTLEEKVLVSDSRTQKLVFTLKEEMVQFYEDQVQREPNNASAFTELAHLHILAQRFEGAIEALESALGIVSGGRDTSNYTPRLFQEIAKAYRADHYVYGDANATAKFRLMLEDMLERTLDKYPTGENYKTLLQFYQQSGRTDKITALYSKVYHKNPTNWEAAKNYGASLLGAARYPEAREVFDKARKYYPGLWETHYHFGLACLRGAKTKQERADAVDALETALRCAQAQPDTVRKPILDALQQAKKQP